MQGCRKCQPSGAAENRSNHAEKPKSSRRIAGKWQGMSCVRMRNGRGHKTVPASPITTRVAKNENVGPTRQRRCQGKKLNQKTANAPRMSHGTALLKDQESPLTQPLFGFINAEDTRLAPVIVGYLAECPYGTSPRDASWARPARRRRRTLRQRATQRTAFSSRKCGTLDEVPAQPSKSKTNNSGTKKGNPGSSTENQIHRLSTGHPYR